MNRTSRVVVVGGDGRISLAPEVRCFAGDRRGVRDLIRCIKRNAVDVVLLLVRWLGHSEFYAVTSVCRAHGVRFRVISGGASMAQREVRHD